MQESQDLLLCQDIFFRVGQSNFSRLSSGPAMEIAQSMISKFLVQPIGPI